jgi:hypothetical protein
MKRYPFSKYAIAAALALMSIGGARAEDCGNTGHGIASDIWDCHQKRANKSSDRETGEIDKGARAIIGISPNDIRENGIAGGENSILRKPFGNLFGG